MLRARLLLLAILPGAMLLNVAKGFPRQSHEDSKRIEGTWRVTSVQRSGKADPLPVGSLLIFTGDTVEFRPVMAEIRPWVMS